MNQKINKEEDKIASEEEKETTEEEDEETAEGWHSSDRSHLAINQLHV